MSISSQCSIFLLPKKETEISNFNSSVTGYKRQRSKPIHGEEKVTIISQLAYGGRCT